MSQSRSLRRPALVMTRGLSIALLVTVCAVFTLGACNAMGGTASGTRLTAMKASPHYRDSAFFNKLPDRGAGFWRITWSLLTGPPGSEFQSPTEGYKVPIERRGPGDFRAFPASGLRITWLGHSTLLVELDGKRILIDPIWSERASPVSFAGPKRFHPPPLPLEALPAIDAVVISHDHYDHLDFETIVSLRQRVSQFVVPLGVGAHLEQWGVEAKRIVELDWWQHHRLDQVRLTATPARHFSGRSLTDHNATLWSGWAFTGPQHRVFYSGDTAMSPDFAEIGRRLGPFDATMIESGAYNAQWRDVHLGPEQAVAAHVMVRGGLMIPVHWGTFDLAFHGWTEPAERVAAAAKAVGVQLATPRAGQSLEPTRNGVLQRWWPAVPWKTMAQSPIVSSGLSR